MSKTIKVTVPRKGIAEGQRSLKVETDGYVGEGCKTATEAIQNALGTVTADEPTQEMYETEEGVERVSE